MNSTQHWLTRSLGGAVLVLAAGFAGHATAVPVVNADLGLEETRQEPDLTAFGLELDYDATTYAFSILGTGLMSLDYGTSSEDIVGSYSIVGTANESEATLSLSVSGEYMGSNQTLLSGNLLALGVPGGSTLEFLFGDLSGALAGLYGSRAGVIFTDFSLGNLDLSNDLNVSSWFGATNTFAVPTPGTLGLMGLGLAGLVASRRFSSTPRTKA